MSRTFALLAAALLAAPVLAQTDHSGHHLAQRTEAKADATANGEVRKVDKSAGKVTIKHGPLANLDMPAMTMVFRVKDPVMLDQLKSGDTIKFKAEKIGGNYTVTEFQAVK